MFDREFFENGIAEQIEKMRWSTVRGSVNTFAGEVYRLRKVEKVENGYVWFEIYPDKGMTDTERKARENPRGEVVFDRVALRFDAISSVFLTATDPDAGEAIEQSAAGYHAIKAQRDSENAGS